MPARDFELTQEQNETVLTAVNHVITYHALKQDPNVTEKELRASQCLFIIGYAGTGKSCVIQEIQSLLSSYGTNHPALRSLSVTATAFTGRACENLVSKGVDCKTSHSIFYKAILDEKGNLLRFQKKTRDECLSEVGDVIIIEEDSMMPMDMVEHTMTLGLPIILVGDEAQLPPIEGPSVYDAVETVPTLQSAPICSLTQIMRTKKGSNINLFAQSIREENRLDMSFVDNAEIFKTTRSKLNAEWFRNNWKDWDVVLCGKNKDRKAYNRMIRAALGFDPEGPQIGDRVMCLQNTVVGTHRLNNGELFSVVNVFPGEKLTNVMIKKILPDGSLSPIMSQVVTETAFWGQEEASKEFQSDREVVKFTYGYAMTVHKCVHPDTIVQTAEGLMPISMIRGTGIVETRKGALSYEGKVTNPSLPSKHFLCENGYSIITKEDHGMEYFNPENGEWELKPAHDVSIGDYFRLRMHFECDVPDYHEVKYPVVADDVRSVRYDLQTTIDEKYGEFLGMMLADGFFTASGIRLAKRNLEVCERFGFLVSSLFGANPNHKTLNVGANDFYSCEVNSRFIKDRLWDTFPELRPRKKAIPYAIMASPVSVQKSFLRGFFEDGTVNMKGEKADHIEIYNESADLIRYIQVLLLKCGIISTVSRKKGSDKGLLLYIYSESMRIFGESIGFISHKKNSDCSTGRCEETRSRIPVTPDQIDFFKESHGLPYSYCQKGKQRGYLSRKAWKEYGLGAESLRWHYVRVTEVTNRRDPSMCIRVPEDGTFIQNGFSHGNCQGSGFPGVIFVDDDVSFFLDRKAFRYTACTRATERLMIVR